MDGLLEDSGRLFVRDRISRRGADIGTKDSSLRTIQLTSSSAEVVGFLFVTGSVTPGADMGIDEGSQAGSEDSHSGSLRDSDPISLAATFHPTPHPSPPPQADPNEMIRPGSGARRIANKVKRLISGFLRR